MALVVITGGIGAGKSTVLKCFESLGAQTIDADDAVHRLYTPGSPTVAAVAAHFGSEVVAPDGSLDRKALAQRVFGAPLELAWLNALIHPRVRMLIEAAAGALDPEPLFAAVPLWYECGWDKTPAVPAKVVAVWCDPDTQMTRLRQRGWSDAEIARRIKCQLPMDEKLNRADFGIINNGSLERMEEQCREVYRQCLLD